MKKPIEHVRQGGGTFKHSDGTHGVMVQVVGLTEDDAKKISLALQPAVEAIVKQVLGKRGHVTDTYPGKPN